MNISKARMKRCSFLMTQVFIKKYPECFNYKHRKPLAIGVDKQLIINHPEISAGDIKKAIALYVNAHNYLKSCLKHSHRVDLDGVEVAEITEKERLYMQQKIERLKQIKQEANTKKLAEQARLKKEAAEKAESDRLATSNNRPTLTLRGKRPKA